MLSTNLKFEILNDKSIPDPGMLRAYNKDTLNKIKEAAKDGYDITSMSSKLWYQYFLNKEILQSRSFLFLLLNDLLPSKERLHRTTRNTPTAVCQSCQSGEVDSSLHHSFTICQYTSVATSWLVNRINTLDPVCTMSGLVRLQFETTNSDNTLAVTWLTGDTLAYAWARRQNRQEIVLESLKTELKMKAVILSKSFCSSKSGQILVQLIEDREAQGN